MDDTMDINKKLQNKLKQQSIRNKLPAYFKELSDILHLPIDESCWIDPIRNHKIIETLSNIGQNYRCRWVLDRFDDQASDNSIHTIAEALQLILTHEKNQECIYTGGYREELGAIYLSLEQVITHWHELLDKDGNEFWLKLKSQEKQICIELAYDRIGQYTQNVYIIYVYSNDWYLKLRDVFDPVNIE